MDRRYPVSSGYTVDEYFDLVRQGELDKRDHVELLDGVIVAEPPMDPPRASGVSRVAEALRAAVAGRAFVREEKPLIIGDQSVPEPDTAVVPGRLGDYDRRHPTTAFLVVEVSDSSLKQDRLSKSRIYAGAAISEYWIVNVRDDWVEVFRDPDPERRVYADRSIARRGEQVWLLAFPDTGVLVDDLLPCPPRLRDDG
jgi:Uma2 family endonuclease